MRLKLGFDLGPLSWNVQILVCFFQMRSQHFAPQWLNSVVICGASEDWKLMCKANAGRPSFELLRIIHVLYCIAWSGCISCVIYRYFQVLLLLLIQKCLNHHSAGIARWCSVWMRCQDFGFWRQHKYQGRCYRPRRCSSSRRWSVEDWSFAEGPQVS